MIESNYPLVLDMEYWLLIEIFADFVFTCATTAPTRQILLFNIWHAAEVTLPVRKVLETCMLAFTIATYVMVGLLGLEPRVLQIKSLMF